ELVSREALRRAKPNAAAFERTFPIDGSDAVALAAMLADLDPVRDGELRLKIGQGLDLGRPSLLLSRVVKRNGKVTSAHVGGRCAPMMQGTFGLEGKA
ncbi:MAG: PhzF family phenazine biosynthesis protein, partial [Bradyrhizobium sp.]